MWDSDRVHLSPYFYWWVYHPEQTHQSCWFDVAHESQFGLIRMDLHFSQLRSTLCDPIAAHQASLSITSSWSMLNSIELVMPSKHLILCHPFLLLPSVFPSIRVFSNESVLRIRWPKYWSFSFSISPYHEYSELISFRIDWLDLLTVQWTLKSLFQHYS